MSGLSDVLETIKQLNEHAKMLRLYALNRQYICVMEHLHYLDGGIPIKEYPYKQEYLGRDSRTYLNDCRDEIQKKIRDLN